MQVIMAIRTTKPISIMKQETKYTLSNLDNDKYKDYSVLKKETLEEAAERTYQKGLQDDIDLSFYDGVRLGANYQAERMYSEEELKNAIEISVAKALGVMSFAINEESFEQFKKK